MAEEANEREEEEGAKSKQVHGLISSIQANIRVLYQICFHGCVASDVSKS